MNLLLQSEPELCDEFIFALGTAAVLIQVHGDDSFSILSINEMGRAFYGVSELPRGTKLNPENFLRFTDASPEDVEQYLIRMLQNYREVRINRHSIARETAFIDHTGATRWSRSHFIPLIVDDHVARIFITYEDITELRTKQDATDQALSLLISSVLEICGSCEKVRDGKLGWMTLSRYLGSTAHVSHGICPVCVAREMPA